MVYYLSFKSVKDSIEAAESVEDTINYWKTILSLYFSATKGFSLIHPQSREDVIVLRFPRLPQSPDMTYNASSWSPHNTKTGQLVKTRRVMHIRI